ncbi:hypothetical protein QJS04_geneDACA019057 [Acorus gramineus]|uniref:Uncharacterized protein n=1 Tax=Acorus gramineus TaxID=55184 RepID=A0AAV9A7N2_ACOGR|nr:hypothetical protein QJS04_geneDACA019057 [Acorus gramineus]
MKFFVCGRRRAAVEDDDEAKVRPRAAASSADRRSRSAHWRPSLGAISEDGATRSASETATEAAAGRGSRAPKTAAVKGGRTGRVRSRDIGSDVRYIAVALPALAPTGFLF